MYNMSFVYTCITCMLICMMCPKKPCGNFPRWELRIRWRFTNGNGPDPTKRLATWRRSWPRGGRVEGWWVCFPKSITISPFVLKRFEWVTGDSQGLMIKTTRNVKDDLVSYWKWSRVPMLGALSPPEPVEEKNLLNMIYIFFLEQLWFKHPEATSYYAKQLWMM